MALPQSDAGRLARRPNAGSHTKEHRHFKRRACSPPNAESRELLSASHIIPELEADTKTGVIEELANLASRLNLVRDKTWFVGALIERENIMPSATGNGLAFLHTLNRHPEQVVKPFMVLGRSLGGVDFDALDGKPTHLFFVLGLKYHELHLPWLAKLPQMCSRPETLRTLMAAVTADSIFAALSDAERDLGISATTEG